MESDELSPETLKNYKGYINNYFIPYFQGWDIREIRFEQLESFKDSLRSRVRGIKTRRNILNALHALFMWLLRKGVLQVLPIWPVIEGDNAKPRTAIDYSLQTEALQKIPCEHRDVIEFGFETGLRPGETTALKVKDIDTGGGQALIQRTWSGSALRQTTKGKNKRWIPLSDKALEIAVRNIKNKHPEAFLFINQGTARRYTTKKLNQIWRQYSGLHIVHYEAFRHSFCTQINETEGVSSFQAQVLMRHADIRSTQKYFHASPNKLKTVVNNRGKVINLEEKKNRLSLNDH